MTINERNLMQSVKRIMTLEKYWKTTQQNEEGIGDTNYNIHRINNNVGHYSKLNKHGDDARSKDVQFEVLKPLPPTCSLAYSRKQTHDVTAVVCPGGARVVRKTTGGGEVRQQRRHRKKTGH